MHALQFRSRNVIPVHLGHCLLTSRVAALLSASVALASALALWGKVVEVTDALAVLATVAVLHNLAGWLALATTTFTCVAQLAQILTTSHMVTRT